jgi:periplasmic divalent cation tolerance protein
MQKKDELHDKTGKSNQGWEEIVVFITAQSEEEATKIGQVVVKDGLAACANIVPRIKSIFNWQGKLSEESETLMVLKTRVSLFAELAQTVQRLHSYEIPEIIALPIVTGLPSYLDWVRENTQK